MASMTRPTIPFLLALALLAACHRGVRIVPGGVYATRDSHGGYSISKVLAADEAIVHLRSYEGSATTLPTHVDTRKLSVAIGHMPESREVFLQQSPQLLVIEQVQDPELDGYRIYLRAMRGR
jgi:hypothetical protein